MIAYVALGGNLGGEAAVLARFRRVLDELPARVGHVHGVSRVYRSKPVGPIVDQPMFLNAVVSVETSHDACSVVGKLLELEAALGRVREGGVGGAREIDLDLIALGEEIVHVGGAHVPHPRAAQRAFVLLPLRDLAGDGYVLPGQHELLGALCRRPNIAAQELVALDLELALR